MDGTPRIRRHLLSIGSRKRCKRRSSSPQNLLRDGQFAEPLNNPSDATTSMTSYRSPSIISVSDCGIECTPPHKKFSMDDSFDYSPHALDGSFSPSGMLSQTLPTESPEVSWKWNRPHFGNNDETSAATPDSAYAADSSFTSAGSNSTDTLRTVRAGSDITSRRQKLETLRQNKKYSLEQQKRKAEKLKIDETLKRRCAKIQEQLKSDPGYKGLKENMVQRKLRSQKLSKEVSSESPKSSTPKSSTPRTRQNSLQSSNLAIVEEFKIHESINDFFDDSESDCLLVEATQKLESQIVELTQKPLGVCNEKNKTLTRLELPAVVTTPKSSHKEKHHSSLYSKFLEDDSADDWFVSLDDSALEAAQNKSRTGLQRYKSMPAENISNKSEVCSYTERKIACTDSVNNFKQKDSVDSTTKMSARNFKRHASSNIESPSSISCKLQRDYLRSNRKI